jgi:hypothetical protein
MTHWEYVCATVPANFPQAVAEMLSAHGAQDWELVAVVGAGATHWLYFKRPVADEPVTPKPKIRTRTLKS